MLANENYGDLESKLKESQLYDLLWSSVMQIT